ncbi:MAG: glycosyltransferase family 4 protein [Candidatus Rokubacteria bacterium]|nr:glycosyltransferase family 4 protein [Candidatus Rokubacteria bacterium]
MTALPSGLVLFFTYGVSLRTWADGGLLDREVELYRLLRPHVGRLAFVTYGGPEDLGYADHLDGIEVLPNRWGLPAFWMSLLAPLLYGREIRQAAILKTNQFHGAWTAVVAKWLFRKKLIVRGGFVWSLNRERELPGAWTNRVARRLEGLALRAADRAVVTSEWAKEYLVSRYRLAPERVSVIPNHVNTRLFAPDGGEREKGLVCFVGRLSPEKNLPALIAALRGIPGARLRRIGAGAERARLRERAREADVVVEFTGSVPNPQLPALLNRAELFVLPSLYEANPKSLLEAMACGLPVLGSDVDGIREIIRHGETGSLCRPDAASFRAGIEALLADAPLRQRLGENARRHVLERNSIEAILKLELDVLTEALGAP